MNHEIDERLERIEHKLDLCVFYLIALFKGERILMATLDAVLADVTTESTAIDSVGVLIQGLKDQIAAQGLSAADQAKVDAIFAAAETNKQKIAAALAANVPPPATP